MQPKNYSHAPRLPEGERVTLDTVVPGTEPLMLEIGSGRGMFTVAYATQHPEHRVLALEIRRKYAAQLADRLASKKLANARCLAEDARSALPRLGPDGAVSFAAVHFPDPWWKRKHAKRLVVGDVVLAELARLLGVGGLLFVQTDVEERAQEYLERLRTLAGFENAAPVGETYVAESPYAPARSNREARAIADGLPVYRMLFRRTS